MMAERLRLVYDLAQVAATTWRPGEAVKAKRKTVKGYALDRLLNFV